MIAAMPAPSTERELVLTRLIDAPREKVYRAWTEPELLKKWFAPLPWTTSRAELDVRPGGSNLVVMRSPEGQEFPNPGIYLEVVKNERLVTTDAYTARVGALGKALHDPGAHLRERGRKDEIHGPRSTLVGRGPGSPREDGLPPRAGAEQPTSSRRW